MKLFGKLFGRRSHSSEQGALVNTPDGLTAKDAYLSVVAGLNAENARLHSQNRRSWLLAFGLGAGLVGVALQKKTKPYFVEVDSSTGKVSLSASVAESFTPSKDNTSYFIRKWLLWLLLINSETVKKQARAISWTRGSASNEVEDWVLRVDQTPKRMVDIQGLTREIVGSPIVTYNESGKVALVDLTWLERIKGVESARTRKLVTLEFSFFEDKAPTADEENPLGLVIKHFTISNQIIR